MKERKPLTGIRVVEYSSFVAAPSCARILADWGADVIKIESPEGDTWRRHGINFHIPADNKENGMFLAPNANKKDIVLNLRSSEGCEILGKLLEDADIFITNARVSVLKKIGFDYDSVKDKYPRLIYAMITGYGLNGPDALKPGFDYVSFWNQSGFVSDMNPLPPENAHFAPPCAPGDTLAGTFLVGPVMAALYNREYTGKGDLVENSLFGSGVWLMGIMALVSQPGYEYKYPRLREDTDPVATTYMCSDGNLVAVTVLKYERDFPLICKVLGLEKYINDERYSSRLKMLDPANLPEILKAFEDAFITKTAKEWSRIFEEIDVVCDVANHYTDLLNHPQAVANGYMADVTFQNGRTIKAPRPSMTIKSLGIPEYRPAPMFGEHTEEIMRRLGYSEEQIAEYEDKGFVFAYKE